MKKLLSVILAWILLLTCAALPAQAADGDRFQEGAFTYERLPNGNLMLVAYEGDADEVYIPANSKGYAVERIGEYAFDGARMRKVTIPESVKMISAFAFNNCANIQRIDIPNSVRFIDGNPFTGCASLVNIYVKPDHPTLKVILEDQSLYNMANKMLLCYPCSSKKENYKVQEGTVTIGKHAFQDCKALKKVELPESVTQIGDEAFSFCSNLTEMKLPASLLTIGQGAFMCCQSLTEIEIPDSVQAIHQSTFFKCSSLTGVAFPRSLTEIGDRAFCQCGKLTEIRLPDQLSTIGSKAFYECAALKAAYVPNTVNAIGENAFGKCSPQLYLHLNDENSEYAFASIYAEVCNISWTNDRDKEFLKK